MEPNTATTPRPGSTAELARQMNEVKNQTRAGDGDEASPLLPRDLTEHLRESWTSIQAGFVDEPRRAVQEADQLVASAIKHIAETFAQEREKLEAQWDREGDVSTEDLRVALTRYRSFFHRLLSM